MREVSKQGEGGKWFDNSVLQNVGKGTMNSFWDDRWTHESPHIHRFPRVCQLNVQGCKIREARLLE